MRQWNTIKGNQSNRPEYGKNWDNEYDEVMNALDELPLTEAV